MRILLAILSFTVLFLFSCRKEISLERGNNTIGNASTGSLLVKAVSKNGADSTVVVYAYNAAGKLISITTTGIEGGSPINNQRKLIRNSLGVLQKVIYKDIDLAQYGVDSVYSNIYYDVALARYTYSIQVVDIPGYGTTKDSTVLIYNTAGKVVTELGYTDDGTGYQPGGKIEYTYTGNNIATSKVSTYNSGVYEEDFTVTYEYDSKTAPLTLGFEGFLVDLDAIALCHSSNNIIKATGTYPTDPPETTTLSYTYNSINKPITAVITSQPGNLSYSGTYYYH